MNSIDTLMKQIRMLPYNDMIVVASEVAKSLQAKRTEKIDAHMMATALLALSVAPPELSEQSKREEQVLGKIFSRKRTINVSRHNSGWTIEVPSLPASQVIGTELRVMLPMLLDQIITMHVLQERK